MNERNQSGVSLIDVMITIALFSIIAGMAVPALGSIADSLKLGQGLREVEREMQTARLKAVTSNRPIRVRFNCPVAGQYRMVELVGTPASPDPTKDSTSERCQEGTYPFPADSDRNPLTRPNHDGPMRRLPQSVSFGAAATLEFWPDGSVHKQVGTTLPWPVVSTTEITLVKNNVVRKITVNGLGKIQLIPE